MKITNFLLSVMARISASKLELYNRDYLKKCISRLSAIKDEAEAEKAFLVFCNQLIAATGIFMTFNSHYVEHAKNLKLGKKIENNKKKKAKKKESKEPANASLPLIDGLKKLPEIKKILSTFTMRFDNLISLEETYLSVVSKYFMIDQFYKYVIDGNIDVYAELNQLNEHLMVLLTQAKNQNGATTHAITTKLYAAHRFEKDKTNVNNLMNKLRLLIKDFYKNINNYFYVDSIQDFPNM